MNQNLCNLISTLKNGSIAKKQKVTNRNTVLNCAFLNVLWDEGIIPGYKINSENNKLEVFLKYVEGGRPGMAGVILLSSPGQKNSQTHEQLCKLKLSNSLVILSTNEGFKTLDYCLSNRLGGLLIARVW